MEKTALRIRARAVMRCGELFKEIEKAQGGDHTSEKSKSNGIGTFASSPRQKAAKDAGLSKRQVVTAICSSISTQVKRSIALGSSLRAGIGRTLKPPMADYDRRHFSLMRNEFDGMSARLEPFDRVRREASLDL